MFNEMLLDGIGIRGWGDLMNFVGGNSRKFQ